MPKRPDRNRHKRVYGLRLSDSDLMKAHYFKEILGYTNLHSMFMQCLDELFVKELEYWDGDREALMKEIQDQHDTARKPPKSQ